LGGERHEVGGWRGGGVAVFNRSRGVRGEHPEAGFVREEERGEQVSEMPFPSTCLPRSKVPEMWLNALGRDEPSNGHEREQTTIQTGAESLVHAAVQPNPCNPFKTSPCGVPMICCDRDYCSRKTFSGFVLSQKGVHVILTGEWRSQWNPSFERPS
jgi:hypothetical protein